MEFSILSASSGQHFRVKAFVCQQARVPYPEGFNRGLRADCRSLVLGPPHRPAVVMNYFDSNGALWAVRRRQRIPDMQITNATARRASEWLAISSCEGITPSSSGKLFSRDTEPQGGCASGKKVVAWLR